MAALIITALTILAAAWLLNERDKRHTQERARLLELMHTEREQMALRAHDERTAMLNAQAAASPDLTELVALIDRLAQRIQAPEIAVAQETMRNAEPSPDPISMFNDEQYWESKEQLAERLAAEEVSVGQPS